LLVVHFLEVFDVEFNHESMEALLELLELQLAE
jgi:hypothetical protein